MSVADRQMSSLSLQREPFEQQIYDAQQVINETADQLCRRIDNERRRLLHETAAIRCNTVTELDKVAQTLGSRPTNWTPLDASYRKSCSNDAGKGVAALLSPQAFSSPPRVGGAKKQILGEESGGPGVVPPAGSRGSPRS